MSPVIQLPRAVIERSEAGSSGCEHSAIATETVYVVFTSADETLAAVRVARDLAEAMGVPLTLIHFRTVPFALPLDQPTGVSPVQTEGFAARLRAQRVNVLARVHLCRDERRTSAVAFKPHSLIVVAGQHSWLPTQADRWRRLLEAAGHFVVFVDTSEHQEASRA